MPKIVRQPKARGNTDYAKEVAAGKPDILDVEIDLDFNTLYQGVNQLDTSNIAANAGILYTQLNLSNPVGIRDKDVTLPSNRGGPSDGGIDGKKIRDSTLPGTVFPPGSIPPGALGPNSVVLSNIAPTQATAFMGENGDDAAFTTNPAFTELLLAEQAWTPRGGWYLVIASVVGYAYVPSEAHDIYLRLKLDGNAGDPTTGTLVHEAHISFDTSGLPLGGSSPRLPFSALLIHQGNFFASGSGVAHRYKVVVFSQRSDSVVTSKRIIIHETA